MDEQELKTFTCVICLAGHEGRPCNYHRAAPALVVKLSHALAALKVSAHGTACRCLRCCTAEKLIADAQPYVDNCPHDEKCWIPNGATVTPIPSWEEQQANCHLFYLCLVKHHGNEDAANEEYKTRRINRETEKLD